MMELKTLCELNRDFMSEGGNPDREPRHMSIVPKVIEVNAPWSRRTSAKGAESSENTRARDGIEYQQDSSVSEETTRSGKSGKPNKSGRAFKYISNAIFYLAVVLVMLTVLTSGTDTGMPKSIFGFSYFTVVSHSMQNEIPKGSFILVKATDAQELKVGDTITYMRDASTSVTHKIVDIYENYAASGDRGFQTQGVNNANPDSEIVHGSAIVGKVVLVLPQVGAFMAYLASNVYIVFIVFSLCVIISFCLRGILAKPKNHPVRAGPAAEELVVPKRRGRRLW